MLSGPICGRHGSITLRGCHIGDSGESSSGGLNIIGPPFSARLSAIGPPLVARWSAIGPRLWIWPPAIGPFLIVRLSVIGPRLSLMQSSDWWITGEIIVFTDGDWNVSVGRGAVPLLTGVWPPLILSLCLKQTGGWQPVG